MTPAEFINEGVKFYLGYDFDLTSARKHVIAIIDSADPADVAVAIADGAVDEFFMEYDVQYWED